MRAADGQLFSFLYLNQNQFRSRAIPLQRIAAGTNRVVNGRLTCANRSSEV